jgi:hypothetical protein
MSEEKIVDLHSLPLTVGVDLAACRRERTSSHVGHSGSACVAHGADKSTRTERGRSQSWVGDGDRMGWKDATVPALGPG